MDIIKFNNINEICSKYKLTCNDNHISYIQFMLELFNNNIYDSNTTDSYMLNLIGLYYQNKIKDYEMMKKYYLKAIELGCGIAANNLGDYYRFQLQDFELMEKYYLKAIELSYNQGLENLEDFYSNDKLKLYKILINWKNTVENVDLNIINFINEKLFILEKENESI